MKNKKTEHLVLYSPHDKQLEMHECTARYRIGAFGRQSGKSTWGNQEILRKSWLMRNGIYWYVLPIYGQATIMYERMIKSLWNCRGAIRKHSDSKLFIRVESGSTIHWKSGDKPNNLRTETLNGAIIDEVREQSPELWPMVIQPMLRTTKGWGAFISTPNGYDHFFDLAERAKEDKAGRWSLFHSSSLCNPAFSKEEYEEARQEMSEPQFAQEILAEFRDLTKGRVYFAYDSAVHQREYCPWAAGKLLAPWLPTVLCLDFNLSPMSWTLAQERVGDWWAYDEIHLERSHTQEAANLLVTKLMQYGVATVVICGDATAEAGQRAAAGASDYDILLKTLDTAGITWVNRTPETNPFIKDRVNAVNAKLRSANGEIHFWHSPLTKALKKDMQRVVWKDVDGFVLDSGPTKELAHASDGIGYAISKLTPVASAYQVGRQRVIRR